MQMTIVMGKERHSVRQGEMYTKGMSGALGGDGRYAGLNDHLTVMKVIISIKPSHCRNTCDCEASAMSLMTWWWCTQTVMSLPACANTDKGDMSLTTRRWYKQTVTVTNDTVASTRVPYPFPRTHCSREVNSSGMKLSGKHAQGGTTLSLLPLSSKMCTVQRAYTLSPTH